MELIKGFVDSIASHGLRPTINLDRPTYIQPEDRLQFRAARIIVILGMLNIKFGLSKEVIACVDFLLRNEHFQSKFIFEYFGGKKIVFGKLQKIEKSNMMEIDFNIVQYKSVPWDIRFNDIFMYLHVREYIEIRSDSTKSNIRLKISEKGSELFTKLKGIFPSEVNFLDLFGKRMETEKAIQIITEVIPNSYWKQNVSINNK